MALIFSSRNGVTELGALSFKDLGYIGNFPGSGVPIFDQDIHLLSLIQDEARANILRNKTPSGWLTKINQNNDLNLDGSLNTNPLNVNHFFLRGENEVVIDGHITKIVRSKDPVDNKITLNTVPAVAGRTDLVFLELWFKEVTEPLSSSTADRRTAGLLDDGTFAPFGNVDFYGTSLRNGGITFDGVDPAFGVEANRRVQLQYRIRVVDNVDIGTKPEGIDDSSVVKAWPTNKRDTTDTVLETALTYTKSTMDEGLFVSGAGDTASKLTLGTMDGFIYAIPMALIARRNNTAFNQITNANGVDAAVGGVSDRPDGLFYDQIDKRDIIDLRHQVTLNGFDFKRELQSSLDLLVRGDLNTKFGVGDGVGANTDVKGSTIMYAEQFGGNDFNNINNRNIGNNVNILDMDPNGQRRNWNDAVNSETNHAKVDQGASILPMNVSFGVRRSTGSGNWVLNDVVKITSPSWAFVDVGSIFIFDAAGNDVTSDFNIIATDITSVDCILAANPPAWTTDQNIHVVYDVFYPIGGGVVFAPQQFLKIEDQTGALVFGDSLLVSQNLYDMLGTGDFNVVYDANSQFGLQYSEDVTATVINQIDITLPTGSTAVGIGGVNNISTTTRLESNIVSWSQVGQVVTIIFTSGIVVTNLINVAIYVSNVFTRLQNETKAVKGIFETKEIDVILDGAGNGQTFLEFNEVGDRASDMYGGTVNLKDSTGNVLTGTVTVKPHVIEVTGASVVSQTIKATVVLGKTFVGTEFIRIWYDYNPYQGIGAVWNDVEIKDVDYGLVTGGSGSLGGFDVIGIPPITQLPLGSTAKDHLFAGEEIIDNLTALRDLRILGSFRDIDKKQVIYDRTFFTSVPGTVERGAAIVNPNLTQLLAITGLSPIANSIISFGGAFVMEGTRAKMYVSTVENSLRHVLGGVLIDPSTNNSAIDSFDLFGKPLVK